MISFYIDIYEYGYIILDEHLWQIVISAPTPVFRGLMFEYYICKFFMIFYISQ